MAYFTLRSGFSQSRLEWRKNQDCKNLVVGDAESKPEDYGEYLKNVGLSDFQKMKETWYYLQR